MDEHIFNIEFRIGDTATGDSHNDCVDTPGTRASPATKQQTGQQSRPLWKESRLRRSELSSWRRQRRQQAGNRHLKHVGREEMTAKYLRSITVASLPLGALQLRIGAPPMLMRNLDPQHGLCNGTRMTLLRRRHCLDVGGHKDPEMKSAEPRNQRCLTAAHQPSSPSTPSNLPDPYAIGSIFANINEAKEALLQHTVAKELSYRPKSSDKRKLHLCCHGWSLRIVLEPYVQGSTISIPATFRFLLFHSLTPESLAVLETLNPSLLSYCRQLEKCIEEHGIEDSPTRKLSKKVSNGVLRQDAEFAILQKENTGLKKEVRAKKEKNGQKKKDKLFWKSRHPRAGKSDP
ncbi:hypothetical protein V8E54_001367 [Elaphomyces granulatus]